MDIKTLALVTNLQHPTGLNMVRSLTKERIPVIGLTNSPQSPCAHTKLCRIIPYGESTGKNLIQTLLNLSCQFKSKPVLFPASDPDVITISENREILQPFYNVILPSKNIVNTLMFKNSFSRWAKSLGFSSPNFLIFDKNSFSQNLKIKFPCAIKPNFKTKRWGEKFPLDKIIFIHNMDEFYKVMPIALQETEEVLVQEWVPGAEKNIVFCLGYFNRSSDPLATLTVKKIRQWPPNSGTGCLVQAENLDKIRELTINIMKTARYVGIGSIEFKYDDIDKDFKAIEVTVGRPDLQIYLSTICGINIPAIAYWDAIGEELIPIHGPKDNDVAIKWLDEIADFEAARYNIREGKLSWLEWLNSLRNVKVLALWNMNDPKPFILTIKQLVKAKLQKIFLIKSDMTSH